MAHSARFSLQSADSAGLMAARVLSAMTVEFRDFSYTQGHDRYVFVTLLLGLYFCEKSGLPVDFAEAVCFQLTHKFVKLTRISSFLADPAEIREHFERMDDDLMMHAPAWMLQLRSYHHSSVHFALRWELLLFADEYPIDRLLLLWDQVLARIHEYSGFMYALCIAHVKQVPLPTERQLPIEILQTYRDWDVYRAIDDADQIMKWKRVDVPWIRKLVVFLVGVALLIGVLGLWSKRTV
jgi:hypothetical protein